MPIYEYQCQSCSERQEELQGINDPHLTECKACGGPLKRLISSPAFQFKGSGWYVTDYAKSGSDGEKKAEAAGGDGSGKASGKENKVSDSKSESKSESGSKAS